MSNTAQFNTMAPTSNKATSKSAKTIQRMAALIRMSEKVYVNDLSPRDARNLAYYRGNFWQGDGNSAVLPETRRYRASQNEVFPTLDTIASSLAMDLPQVEALDLRQRVDDVPGRSDDPTFEGRRIAAALNKFAEDDDLDETTYELVLHALLFSKGGVVKTSWSTALGRPIWRVKMPWDVFFDTNAKRPSEAAWAFERFPLHIEDLEARIKSGVYKKPKLEIDADLYPRTLLDDNMPTDLEQQARRKGLAEYVLMHEFWDFRKGLLYHIHVGTQQVLMKTKMPYGRPYEVLTFNAGVGRIRGVAASDLIADVQMGINELVAARREIVHRLPRRMLIDQAIFRSAEEFDKFKNARSWEPTLAQFPPGGDIKQHIWVSPEMPTTFDFNKHLAEQVENIKRIPGVSDAERGVVRNIRTAAEVDFVRAGTQGRMNIRRNRVVKVVKRMFERGLDVTRWAIRNAKSSGIDIVAVTEETQADGFSPYDLARIIVEKSTNFRVLPFSPLMEDRNVRREQLLELGGFWATHEQTSRGINWDEYNREAQELYNVRPSVLKSTEEIQQEQAAAAATEQGVDGKAPNSLAAQLKP